MMIDQPNSSLSKQTLSRQAALIYRILFFVLLALFIAAIVYNHAAVSIGVIIVILLAVLSFQYMGWRLRKDRRYLQFMIWTTVFTAFICYGIFLENYRNSHLPLPIFTALGTLAFIVSRVKSKRR